MVKTLLTKTKEEDWIWQQIETSRSSNQKLFYRALILIRIENQNKQNVYKGPEEWIINKWNRYHEKMERILSKLTRRDRTSQQNKEEYEEIKLEKVLKRK